MTNEMGQYANNIKINVLVDGTYLFSGMQPRSSQHWTLVQFATHLCIILACTSVLHANNNRYIKMMRKKEKGKEKKIRQININGP
jgi:hypothetical protein